MTDTITSLPSILVFDSGAGGLTIAKEILSLIPACSVILATDRDYFPYGTKDDAALTQRIVKQLEALVEAHSPALVVVACNTASTLALDTLRREFSCPFVGVVPAIKPAALNSQSGVIGVLATPATVKRPYTHELISEFAHECEVILLGSDFLVEAAEAKLAGKAIHIDTISQELDPFLTHTNAAKMDTIVLACTHFPLLCEELTQWAAKLPQDIQWIDSGQAIARRVKHLLGEQVSLSQQALEQRDVENRNSRSSNMEVLNNRITFELQDSSLSGGYLEYLNS
ncbi:MAG: glutamate racemase [Agarilytica sp.]